MTKTYTLEELKKMKSESDLDRIKKTTEKEILKQSISDPDTPYLTDEELREFTTPEDRKKIDERKKDK